MKFRQTQLFSMLKRAAAVTNALDSFGNTYTGGLLRNFTQSVPAMRHTVGIGGDIVALGDNTAAALTRASRGPISEAASDAGCNLGHALGDMFGRLNPDADRYDDREIVALLNQQEEIALLNRETARLKRLARIQKRRKKKLKDLTNRSFNSPFI